MAEIITIEQVLNDKAYYAKLFKRKILIFPGINFYLIGCTADDTRAINKIRETKETNLRPFFINAPSKSWIYENFEVNSKEREIIKEMPENHVLLYLKPKESNRLSKKIAPLENKVGVILFDNSWQEFVKYLKEAFAFTTAAMPLESPAKTIDELPRKLVEIARYIIDAGQLNQKKIRVIKHIEEI